MRWKERKYPEIGVERMVEKFLWFPACANEEWRWLEKVKIQQRYETVRWEDIMGVPIAWGWVNKAWVD